MKFLKNNLKEGADSALGFNEEVNAQVGEYFAQRFFYHATSDGMSLSAARTYALADTYIMYGAYYGTNSSVFAGSSLLKLVPAAWGVY